jgi:hypothetical protein
VSETTTEPDSKYITLRKGATIVVDGVRRKIVSVSGNGVRLVRIDGPAGVQNNSGISVDTPSAGR